MFAMTRIAMASRSLSAGISLVGTASGSLSGFSYNVNLPAGVAAGDLILVLVGVGDQDDGAGTYPTPSAWPTISGYTSQALTVSSSGYLRSALYYKRLTAADSSLTVNNSSGLGSAAVVYALRGVHAATPFDVAVTTLQSGTYGTANPPTITPVTPGAMVIAGGFLLSSAVGLASAPAGYSNLVAASLNHAARIYVGAAFSRKAWTGSGAEDPAPYPGGSSSFGDIGAGYSIALRPA